MCRNRGNRLRHRAARVCAAVFVALVATAAPAAAHVDVVGVDPADGSVLDRTPSAVTVELSRPPTPGSFELKLFYRDGSPIPLNKDPYTIDGQKVTIHPPTLDRGTYVLTVSSTGPDGHITAEQYSFSVGAASGPPSDLRPRTPVVVQAVQALSRFVLYATLAAVIGLALLGGYARRGLRTRRDPASLGALAAKLFAAAVVARLGAVAVGVALTGGSVSLLVSSFTAVIGWVLLAGAAVAVHSKRRAVVLGGAAVAVGAETLTGHLLYSSGLLSVALASLHLGAVLVWIALPGAALACVTLHRSVWAVLLRHSTVLLGGAALCAATSGLLLYLNRTGGVLEAFEAVSSPYGRVVLAKTMVLVGVVGAAAVHLLGRRRLRGTDHEAGRQALRSVLRSIQIEVALLVVIAGAGASLAGLAMTRSTSGGEDLLAAPDSYVSCAAEKDESSRFLCVTRYFEAKGADEGIAAAVKELSELWYSGDTWMMNNCHPIGHRIGRIGWLKYKDIAKAFAQGSDPCDYGYLHGVIEGAASMFDDERLRAEFTTMCEVIPGGMAEHTYRQCVHGLGHAAARRVNNDLTKVVEYCKLLHDPGADPNGDQASDDPRMYLCITGASMEWNASAIGIDSTNKAIGADETLLGECQKLDPLYQSGCIEYGTSRYALQLDKLADIRDWCDDNLENPLACYRSIGRDSVGPGLDYRDSAAVCLGGSSEYLKQQCLYRAMGNIATRTLRVDTIDPYCEVLPTKYQPTCALIKETMAEQIKQMTRGYIVEKGTKP